MYGIKINAHTEGLFLMGRELKEVSVKKSNKNV